ncbi:MAG TPA: SDR family oxidoreductase [Sporichthyaceae bacterium]|nr:SDR family oxidoreductase [Sporichthyaceae bacterium]
MADSTLPQFRLDGKVALVTGAGGVLGAAIAETLAAAGAAVMVTDVREKEGEATADALRAAGAKAEFRVHDVTDEASWNSVVDATIATLGGLDVLVNNAGVERMAFITECTVEEYRWIQDVNSTGTFLGCKVGVTAMRPDGAAGRGGSIVNLSSAAGLIGVTALHAYSASKGAVRLLTKTVAVECAQLKTGIRCNSLHPSVVESAMGDHFLQNFVDLGLTPDLDTTRAAFLAQVPMGEWALPADVGNAALFLASDAARFITGAELSVDGGFTAT